MQSCSKARDILNNNEDNSLNDQFIMKSILFQNTYTYNESRAECYKYEVNLIVLYDFNGKNSIVNQPSFEEFVNQENLRIQNIHYDMDIHIRDLYSVDEYYNNCKAEDIANFEILNDFILSSYSLDRRINKKEIVYKKNKIRNIISFKIGKYSGLKIFLLKDCVTFDFLNKFSIISKGNCKPLEMYYKIKNQEDVNYVKQVLNDYIAKIFMNG